MSHQEQKQAVYVFEVSALRLQKDNGGEPMGQEFASDKEAVAWVMKQPGHKKFVMLKVINGGAQSEEQA